jgi:hypothetical protein
MPKLAQRFFVQSSTSLFQALGEWLSPLGAASRHETVFFDDALLSLGGDAKVRARRRIERGAKVGASEAAYVVSMPRGARKSGEALSLPAATEALRRAHRNDKLAPYAAAQFRRQEYALGDVGTLTLESEVAYFGVLEGRFVAAGEETHPRVAITFTAKPSKKLAAALAMLPKLPHSSKRWMAYFRMRKLVKPRRINELPGYEYEVKLDADHLDIDPTCLPMPIHRVYQTESTRYYYEGHRIQFRAFRTERATLVRKGEVEVVEGVPRRAEEKVRKLSPWQLPKPRHAMRRVKKTYLLMHPVTERMYNLCLEVCEANGDALTQIEIEYRGRTSIPRRPGTREQIEAEVLADLRAIRDALAERHGMAETFATKRSWLKKRAA